MPDNRPFTFEISLSVLDHLGRNLYRSFATVLGEAISNAWDADADNVYIYVDREKNSFFIKDDGTGMDEEDFQKKFLKIGYSKRKEGDAQSDKGRPYIGRKGIGKLALLSCAERITVISRKEGGEYVGGTIDNSGLDHAITEDLTPQEYPLEGWSLEAFGDYAQGHAKGTIIHFENLKDGIRNSLGFLEKIIALYFRFALIDESFNIYVNGEKITLEHLRDLAEKTEFAWNINGLVDPYVSGMLTSLKEAPIAITMEDNVQGFVASVTTPKRLKIYTTDERVGVDLFVNGRLRERDILKHIPTARIAESYFYGQIHFNELDDDKDRFTSSREGIIADDVKYEEFLNRLRTKIIEIASDWDRLRIRHRKDGDPENENIPRKERKARELYNVVSGDFDLPEGTAGKSSVDGWVDELATDAAFNFASYAECFMSENLVRKYVEHRGIALSPEAQRDIADFKRKESQNKTNGNVNIELRQVNIDLSYLDMAGLANLVDRPATPSGLPGNAKQYRPIRDALMHTARLTDEAKRRLTTVFEDIKARVKTLLSSGGSSS